MTVSTTDSQIDYSSGGPSFPIPFKFLRDEDIRPVLTLADGSQVTLVQNVQFTITGAGSETGGTLTSAYAQTALATAGTLLRISRVMDPTQETDLRNQGRYFAETHERVFDKLTMLVQQSLTGVANALSLNSLKNRWDFRGLRGVNAGNPIDPQDVTTKSYVDSSNAAQDSRIDSLSAGLPGTNYAFPWSTTTTTGTKTLTPGFEFASAVLYINGIAQTYGKAFAVSGNQIVLAEAIPAGTEVYAILGQNVVPSDYLTKAELADSSGASLISYLAPSSAYLRSLDQKISDWVDPRDYGAVSGSSSDSSSFFMAAANAARSKGVGISCSGTYRLAESVDFREIPLDMESCTFYLDTSDKIGLILGGSASQSWNPAQSVGRVFRVDESLSVPSVRVMGAKGQKIYIGRSHFVQLYASTSAPDRNRNYSIAYSTFTLGHVNQISLDTDPSNAGGPANSDTGGTVQWINQNIFHIDRCHGLLIDGTYTHNKNVFLSGTFEGPVTINMNIGFHNYLLDTRFESGPTTILFGANSANCWIRKSWDGVIDDRQAGIISGTVIDLGTANVVSDDFGFRYNTDCIAYAAITDPWLNNSVDLPGRVAHLQRVGGSAGNSPILVSDKIRIERNMQFYWAWLDADASDTVLYRPFMEFFDKNGVPINAASAWALTPGASTPSGNFLSTGTGVGSSNYWATIVQPAIAAGALYVRAGVRISGGQVANSLARSIAIYCAVPHNVKFQGAAEGKRKDMMAVSAPPTQGFVPVGFTCVRSTDGTLYVCTFAFESTSTAAAASGATTITLAAATGVAVGDRVGVNLDNRDTHWTTVNAISGTSLTLTSAIPSASASGSRVVFNRQITK